jgi:hypothetical protein
MSDQPIGLVKAWADSQSSNAPKPVSELIDVTRDMIITHKVDNLAPLLPMLLRWKGKPMSLRNFFPMEPWYRIRDIPPRQLLLCGRQISKSLTLVASNVLKTAATPFMNTIFVTPLFEQVRRLSNEYVRVIIEDSPMARILTSSKTSEQVLHRSFCNGSNLYFTYAFLDAERARGIPGDVLVLDEFQDINLDFLPILESCLDASPYGLVQMSGTPKTSERGIEVSWQNSSKAEWTMKCRHCSKYNMASMETGLWKMLKPAGFSCMYCEQLLFPEDGFFYHNVKSKADSFPGWHIPQPIMPMHYANPHKWATLMRRKDEWPTYRFLNEVLGVSSDTGVKLITREEIQNVCTLPWQLDEAQALVQRNNYTNVVMSVDWGAGAAGELRKRRGQLEVIDGTASFTVIAITGLAPNGDVHLLYAERLGANMGDVAEAKRVTHLYFLFKCSWFAHDYGGAGFLRETAVVQAGLPYTSVIPLTYASSVHLPIISYNPPTEARVRHSYTLDKARSLTLTCLALKGGMIRFPKWEEQTINMGEDETTIVGSASLYSDFLALIPGRTSSYTRSDTMLIARNPRMTDDFCHALNFGCAALWHISHQYPKIAQRFGINFASGVVEPED